MKLIASAALNDNTNTDTDTYRKTLGDRFKVIMMDNKGASKNEDIVVGITGANEDEFSESVDSTVEFLVEDESSCNSSELSELIVGDF